MSANIKTFINYDRFEMDKNNRPIHIWRQRISYLSKQEVIEARKNKENMKVNVDA